MTEEIRIIIEALQEAFGAVWGFGESVYPVIVREFAFYRVFRLIGTASGFIAFVGLCAGLIIVPIAFTMDDMVRVHFLSSEREECKTKKGLMKLGKVLLYVGVSALIIAVTAGVLRIVLAPNYMFFLSLLR